MLFEEIKNCFCLGELNVLLCGENSVYLTGVGMVKFFTKTEIIFSQKRGQIKIIGENLEIKKYSMGDALICGKIKSLERE